MLVEALEERTEHNPAAVYLAKLVTGSRPAMRAALEVVAAIASGGREDVRSFPWASLRYAHMHAIRAALAERYAPRTVKRHLSAVRGLLHEAWRMAQIDSDATSMRERSRACAGRACRSGATSQCASGSVSSTRAPRTRSRRAARDAAMLGLLAGTGVRRAEVVALDLAHVREDRAVRVLGKGNKERLVYLVDDGGAHVEPLPSMRECASERPPRSSSDTRWTHANEFS